MKTLKELYMGQTSSQEFRFIDWNHRTKFLKIIGYDEIKGIFHCILDSGEKIEIDDKSDFWQTYSPGDEFRACAI